jgi:hypothetical protein
MPLNLHFDNFTGLVVPPGVNLSRIHCIVWIVSKLRMTILYNLNQEMLDYCRNNEPRSISFFLLNKWENKIMLHKTIKLILSLLPR